MLTGSPTKNDFDGMICISEFSDDHKNVLVSGLHRDNHKRSRWNCVSRSSRKHQLGKQRRLSSRQIDDKWKEKKDRWDLERLINRRAFHSILRLRLSFFPIEITRLTLIAASMCVELRPRHFSFNPKTKKILCLIAIEQHLIIRTLNVCT